MSPNLSAKPSPLLLSSAAKAEVDHKVERRVQHCQQVVDTDQNKDPLKKKIYIFNRWH